MTWNEIKFDEACQKFRNHFPDFETFVRPGKQYVKAERNPKDNLANLYNANVRPLLAKSTLNFFRAYVDAIHQAGGLFVDWRYVSMLSDLKDSEASQHGSILKQVIESDADSDSITTYGWAVSQFLKSVHGSEYRIPYAGIRNLVYLLFMLDNPRKFMCETFTCWNQYAKLLIGDDLINCHNLVTGEEFIRCQEFAMHVFTGLEIAGFQPRDMIDVQGFLYTAGNQTSERHIFQSHIEQFKRQYTGFRDFTDSNCGETYGQYKRRFKEQVMTRYHRILKPLIEGDSVHFLDAYAELIDLYIQFDSLVGLKEWRTLTNGLTLDRKQQLGSLLQSLINRDSIAEGADWDSIVTQYCKKSYQLLKDDSLNADSNTIHEKLRESVSLLLSLRWPKKHIHAIQAVWNTVGKKFFGRELINFGNEISAGGIQELAALTKKIRDRLNAENLAPSRGTKFDVQSFLWSVYDESHRESMPRNPGLADIVQAIRSRGMRIDEPVIRQYHFSMRTRGFVILAGPSGVGKTWLTSLYASAVNANYLVAPVAPNWSTNEDLLGFFNPIDGEFHATRFLRFIDEAAELWNRVGSGAKEFHLVLDEMNLARVEHYFSLFLSLMERRRETEIPETRLTRNRVVRIPPNLKFAGTVNMDETTHGFADKVFDRAQLIELSISPNAAREHVSERIGETPPAEVLLDLWDRMAPTCPVGFRVLDEIADYLKLAEQEAVDWREALDEQIVSKLLPKLRGIDPEVAEVLKLIETRVNGEFPKSAAKCQSMLRRARSTDVVSFF